jgi:hypothetical protein
MPPGEEQCLDGDRNLLWKECAVVNEPTHSGERYTMDENPRYRSASNQPTRAKTIGIDIDADTLVCAYLDVSRPRIPIRRYSNRQGGIARLVADAREFAPELVIMESTGALTLPVYDALREAGMHCSVVNPQSLAALLRAGKTKTDATTRSPWREQRVPSTS